MKQIDSKRRSIAKALTYRSMGTVLTILVVFLLTNKWKLAVSAGVFELFLKTALYYWHERLWLAIKWGLVINRPYVIWFTGLSGAGKSTLALKLLNELKSQDLPVELLDGDEVRSVFKNVGFTRTERLKHLEVMAYLTAKIEKQGTIVIGSFITPYEEAREALRKSCANYLEVWIDTSLDECERRDVKGLYAKARSGQVSSFTGISDAFEEPRNFDIKIVTQGRSVDDCYTELINELKKKIKYLKT